MWKWNQYGLVQNKFWKFDKLFRGFTQMLAAVLGLFLYLKFMMLLNTKLW